MTDSQKTYYFLGIGGIGMSALARYFHSLGYRVCGYDRTRTALTRQLEAEGMEIHYEEDINQIPKQLDLVIYTPAIPADNQEFVYLQQLGVPVLDEETLMQVLETGEVPEQ